MEKNSIGSIIKLKRLDKKLTQQELSSEICTPSYLSRIENNQLLADETIYKLLFQKLGIEYTGIDMFNSEIDAKIETWYKKMLERKNISENIYELKKDANKVGVNNIKYSIVYSRYLLMNNEVDKAGDILGNIGSILNPEYNRLYFLYANVFMIYCHLKEDYTMALKTGLSLIKIKDYDTLATEYEMGILYYSLALNYSKVNQSERCIYYAKLALDEFNNSYYFDRAIDCQLLLGISYNRIRFWDKSMKSLMLAKKLINLLPEEYQLKYKGKFYNNIGYCFECQSNYTEAVKYYEKSLEYKKSKNDRLRTILNLVRCNASLRDKVKSEYWRIMGQDIINDNTSKTYKLQFDIFKILLQDNRKIDDIIELQNTSIDYFHKNHYWSKVHDYSIIFATMYEELNHYKKANLMYQLAFKTYQYIQEG